MSDPEPKIITRTYIPAHKAKFVNGKFVEIPDDPDPIFVIDEVIDLQKEQIKLQHITNETLLVQIQKEQNTNALLAEQLAQAEEHNRELQTKLDVEIAKNDKESKRYIPNGILIAICGAGGFALLTTLIDLIKTMLQ